MSNNSESGKVLGSLARQTILNKRNDNLFTGLLWAAVGLTMFILIFIIGYVMVRGFYYRHNVTYDVSDFQEDRILVDSEKEQFVNIIINKRIRIDEIDVELLNNVFNGYEYEWAAYSGQDEELVLYSYKNPDEIYLNAIEAFLAEGDEFSEYAEYVNSEQEMVDMVASTTGGFGFIDADTDVSLEDVKIIRLRRLVVGANPGITALNKHNIINDKGQTVAVGQRLNFIKQKEITSLFSGKYDSWEPLGGADLPVIPVINRDSSSASAIFIDEFFGQDFTFSDNAVFVDSSEEYYETIRTTPGAFGFSTYKNMMEHGMEPVPVNRVEQGVNMTIHFLFEASRKAGAAGGIRDIIINTLLLVVLTLGLATPLGVFAAVYFIEYSKQTRFVHILRLGTDTLNAIPSIIFGLFGYLVFVQLLGFKMGLLSGTLTMTMMILPTIIRTSEEALKSVPRSYREGSLGLGATKWQTILKVVIPAASPGIVNGIILGMGRAIGETAALMFTMGMGGTIAGLTTAGRTMSVHLYYIFSEGISKDRAFATAAILIFVVLLINYSTTCLVRRMNEMSGTK